MLGIMQARASCGLRPDLGYSDKVLHSVGVMMPGKWMTLGVHLGICHKRLEGLIKIKRPDEMAVEMLQMWWQNTTVEGRWGELYHGLLEIHRNDILQLMKDFLKKSEVNYNSPSDKIMRKCFMLMSERMPRDWKNLGIYLNINHDQLNMISSQPHLDLTDRAFKVLKMWQSEKTSAPHQLINALLSMQRMDVVLYLFEELDKSSGIPSKELICKPAEESEDEEMGYKL